MRHALEVYCRVGIRSLWGIWRFRGLDKVAAEMGMEREFQTNIPLWEPSSILTSKTCDVRMGLAR